MGIKLRSLEVAFETPDAFAREYAANIANGGIFVETTEAFSIREKVRIQVRLRYLRQNIKLDGEVVHIVTEGVASAGAKLGVAVHFDASAHALHELFEPVLGEALAELEPATEEHNRRVAPRSRARVSARVCCPGCDEIVGRTRNLSISGVLVSLGSNPPIKVGEPVQVFIANSATGHVQEILGRVARHVAGDGGVIRAIGIQFHIPDDAAAEVEQFLADLAALEHTRHLGGIKGTIEELGLVNLVQTFGLAAREGTLDVIRGAEEGYVAFENGALRAASVGGTHGVKALARMLGWSDGSFEFHARIDPSIPSMEPIPMEAALLEAMRLMDESESVDRSRFPLDALLHVDELQRAQAGPFDKLEDALLDLAATGMNIQRILDVVPETDSELYVALDTLVDQGVIEIWPL